MNEKIKYQPFLDEVVETIGTALPAKLITSLILFFYSPYRLFQWIHERRFDIIMKPVAFFGLCLAISIVLGSLHHQVFDAGWRSMYIQLKNGDKIAFKKLFTGNESLIPVDSLNREIQTRMGLGDVPVKKDLILLYLKVNGNRDLFKIS